MKENRGGYQGSGALRAVIVVGFVLLAGGAAGGQSRPATKPDDEWVRRMKESARREAEAASREANRLLRELDPYKRGRGADQSNVWMPWVTAGAVTLGVLAFGWQFWRIRVRRRRHVAAHPPVGDAEFVKELEIGPERLEAALVLRRAMAKVARVPAETVYASDRLDRLFAMGSVVGSDLLDVQFHVEKALRVRLCLRELGRRCKEDKAPPAETVGELVRLFARYWDGIAQPARR